ncbi:hypothetical protein DEU56DRAFT_274005 [Suillus clintonianus]|uniref:uncharacterized protein n=1 Tax=Suillus clintonianus TaxID=1904413 RepID=UPI001B863CD1|nr:uncharacterized protein DEU56DRAFT_274005 [Suillus clintonianus]KAG2141261.1 hypothetical protein DEU56DRAFT_274005 [Suillus clintonianus]
MAVQKLLLVLTIFVSTCLFALCWAFMIIVWHQEFVILPDSDAILITRYPTVLTLISTVISTILSVITTALFSIAVKNALSHYITRPISLVKFHTAIALSRPQPLLRWNYRVLSLFTLVIVGLVTLLNSSWTTLLLPTRLLWPVPIEGKDLDLGSPAFDAKLGLDMNASSISYTNVYNILDIMSPMSGASATRLAIAGGDNSIFAFNGVSYSKSSSGIVPAIEDFAGNSLTPGGVGLQYFGGKVAVNTSVVNKEHRVRSGLARNYTVTQQGLSANVTCGVPDPKEYSLSILDNPSSAFGGGTITWEWAAHCPLGIGVSYWTTVEFQALDDRDGLLGIVVCPGPYMIAVPSFDIILQGKAGYSFLNATVCKVAPYVASFDVTYSNGNISIDQPRDIQPLQNHSMNVTYFIRSVVEELSLSTQTTYNNPLGELLRLNRLYNTGSMNEILEYYFRGVVEFSATYLRSAYLAEGAATAMSDLYLDESAFKPLSGTMFVATYGWYSGRLTYIYIIGVFTVIWAVTVAAATFSLIQERIHPCIGLSFDASNPIHLMMASSAGGLEALAGFENDGGMMNERVQIRFLDGRGAAPGDAVGEDTSVQPTRSSMRFEIVPDLDGEGGKVF